FESNKRKLLKTAQSASLGDGKRKVLIWSDSTRDAMEQVMDQAQTLISDRSWSENDTTREARKALKQRLLTFWRGTGADEPKDFVWDKPRLFPKDKSYDEATRQIVASAYRTAAESESSINPPGNRFGDLVLYTSRTQLSPYEHLKIRLDG